MTLMNQKDSPSAGPSQVLYFFTQLFKATPRFNLVAFPLWSILMAPKGSPFSSRSFGHDFRFPPLISLHFLAFLLCSQYFPRKNTGFPAFSQRGRQKTQS